jgi:hypothetical protein
MGASRPEGSANEVLVGRSEVLRELTRCRAEAGRGELAVLVLEGEAGIGKTAVAERAKSDAASDGWATVWVQGVEADAAPAYGGLLELLTALRPRLTELPSPTASARWSASQSCSWLQARWATSAIAWGKFPNFQTGYWLGSGPIPRR